MSQQNFLFYMANYCGQRRKFAACNVCGETYWVNDRGNPQANGQELVRCMTRHKQQDRIYEQIAQQIEFHWGRI